MRALPQTEVRSLPVPAQQENPSPTANRGNGHNFAETLQRKSAADDRPESAQVKLGPTEKSSESTENTSKKPTTEATAAAKTKPSTDDANRAAEPSMSDQVAAVNAPVIVEPSTAPTSPLMLGDLGLALAVSAKLAESAVTTPTTDLETLSEMALAAKSSAVTANGDGQAMVSPESEALALAAALAALSKPTAASVADQTALTDSSAQILTTVSANALTASDPATTDLASVMSAATAVTNRIPVGNAANAQIADTQTVSDAVETVANDGDLTAASPPVMASLASMKAALPPLKDHLPAPASEDAPSAELLTSLAGNAPVNSATPAAQTVGMNAVAAAIGDKKSEKLSADSGPLAAKTLSESAFAPLPAAPSALTTVTRPMSETVLAQSTLAANGNPMEKVLSHQVSKALIQHLPNGDRVLVMRLTPPELGTVKIEVIERMGVLTAKLHAEDDGVRLALERFLPSMRQDLRASDAPIRELSMSDQTQFQRSFADGQNQQQQQQNAESSNRRARADEPRFAIDGTRSDTVVAPRGAPLGGRVSLSEVNALA